MSWTDVFGWSVFQGTLNSTIAFAVPLALAGAGEAFSEQSGVLNLGLEGVMLGGALGSFLGAYYTGNPWVGVVVGVMAGICVSSVMATLSVTVKTDQVVSGIAIVLLATGLTSFIYERLFGVSNAPPQVRGVRTIAIPGLSSIPFVGKVFFTQSILVYIAIGVVVAIWLLLYTTKFGLSVRACGENPRAAAASGIDVDRTRWQALVLNGGAAGLGGAVLIIVELHGFQNDVTAGQGFVAIALVIFGAWNPLWVILGALLFGFTDALQLSIQSAQGGLNSGFPYEFFQSLPYLVTIAVMASRSRQRRRQAQPAALGVPYRKEAAT